MFKNIVKIIALGVLGTAFSQSNLNSPYSSFGFGNEAPVNGAVHNSTGVGLAYSSSLFLNTQNPALLSRSHNVVFEYGVNLDANWINTKDQSGNSSSMNIHYFGMSVPVSRRLTTSLGFSPLYKKSFNYQDEQSFDNGNIISSTFTGKSSTNKIYLGNRAYGIQASANVYYGKGISELSLAQLAMIAGLPKAPSAYNPLANPSRALIRRDWILDRMLELGYIDSDEFNTAKAEAVSARYHGSPLDLHAPYIAEQRSHSTVR